tara:strand:- start:3028 stop:3594 length:567 start_codon:yes stop_codon:yes gene_type:complete
MDEKWHKVEEWVDKLIPWMILLLLVIIILEFFYHDFVHDHHLEPWLKYGDWLVIVIFIADLGFKYHRVKYIKDFFKKYWLDIIAVFPFILFFRFFEPIMGIFAKSGSTLKKGQSLLHEGLEVEKAGSRLIKEAEIASRVSRSGRFTRFIRPIARLPRFVKFFARYKHWFKFYDKPSGKHWDHEKKKSK